MIDDIRSEASRPTFSGGSIVKWVLIGAISAGLILIARRVPIVSVLAPMIDRVARLGVWGPIVFGVIYAAAVVLLVPGSALTLASGALFGLVVGTIVVVIASNVGAALAFLIARRLARGAVEKRIRGNPRFEAVDRAVGAGGWKIVALLRLSPVVPFIFQNYFYGLTRIRFWPCVLASLFAMLPGTFLYIYLGYLGRVGLDAATGTGSRGKTPAEWVMIAIGLIATLVVTIYITRLARKALMERADLGSHAKTPEVDAISNVNINQ
jgi:uncharacterized membrane protein YdjX (TVP38/TMEM64 family)